MTKTLHRALTAITLLTVISACSDGSHNATTKPQLTVIPSAAPEGAPGEIRQLRLRVLLTEPTDYTIKVDYETADGSATAGEDYLFAAGTAEIAAGDTSGYIAIDLLGDDEEEDAETLTVSYSTDGFATTTSSEVVATIANDDTACNEPFSNQPNPWLVHGGDPLNFAHRGGVIDFPENTLYAYAEAARAGADVLEMDVYQTLDNELVILHDLTVNRTTNGSGNVANLTLAELRALDAAYWFVAGEGTPHDFPDEAYSFRGIATGDVPPPPGYSAEDFRIPTLEEALARFPDELINIELKPDIDGAGNYEQQIADLLQLYGRFNNLIAASFVDAAANAFKEAAPCIYSSVPLDEGVDLLGEYLGSGSFPPVPRHIAAQVPMSTRSIQQLDFDLDIVDQAFVDAAQAQNLAVQVWTINSCEQMLQLIDFGVDAIMTDRPLLLEEILNTPPAERRCD
jgi:glycerophosphoryl diester phosphodiesterase